MNIFSYQGRMNRAKYFGYSLLAGFVAGILMYFVRSVPAMPGIINLLLIFLNSTFVVQRFHDIEKPGWYFWLMLIPFYNIYLAVILLFKKGTTGANVYGADPLTATATV